MLVEGSQAPVLRSCAPPSVLLLLPGVFWETGFGASQSRRSSGGDGPYSLSCERVLNPLSTKLGNFLDSFLSFLFFVLAMP